MILFPLNNKNDLEDKKDKGVCSCGSRYIGETKHNSEARWNQHDNQTKGSESSKHLRRNINH